MAYTNFNFRTAAAAATLDENRKRLEKDYKNVDEMRADGWTDADLVQLVLAPRTKNATGGNMPYVDGHKICGTSLMKEAEVKAYQAYKKGLSSGSGSSSTATSDEKSELWQSIINKAKEFGDETFLNNLLSVMPHKANKDLQLLFGYDNVALIKSETVSIAWIMFNNEEQKLENRNATIAEIMTEHMDWLPKCGLNQINQAVINLNAAGIDVTIDQKAKTVTVVQKAKTVTVDQKAKAKAKAKTVTVDQKAKTVTVVA